MLKGQKTPLITGLKGKNGRAFSAVLVPGEDGSVTFEFPEKVPLGKCPKCGRPVYENAKGYGCSGYREGACKFAIWKYDRAKKKRISRAEAQKMLNGGAGE